MEQTKKMLIEVSLDCHKWLVAQQEDFRDKTKALIPLKVLVVQKLEEARTKQTEGETTV
jgi:hypothetical protein